MDENKELIAKEASKLFAKKGYVAVGVQEICEKCGITKPTLYYYFKSKGGLLAYLLETKGGELLQLLEESLEYEHDFIKSLTKVLTGEIEFAVKNKDFFNLYTVLLNSPNGSEEKELSKNLLTKIESCFLDFFTSSSAEFGNMRGKEKLYALLFMNNVVSTSSMCANKKIEYDDKAVYQIIHSFVYGVAN